MDTYVILLPGDESYWDVISPEDRARVYAQHEAFSEQLTARGHVITGGAELHHSREGRTLRQRGSEVVVTDGPFAETVEQLTGFYLVQSDDLDDLLEVCKLLMGDGGPEGVIEVRRAVSPAESEAMTTGAAAEGATA